MKTLKRTLTILWSTRRGKTAMILTGTVAVVTIAMLVGSLVVAGMPGRPGATPATPTHPAGAGGEPDFSDGSDLFATAAPKKTGSPQPAPDGTVAIGGPGIPANVNTFVTPEKAEAEPDPATGLVPFPTPVQQAKLTVPLVERYTAKQCASSRVPQARAYANNLIAYLFTFDTRRADWGSFVTPLHDVWVATAGGYGNGADQKEIPGSTWDSRIGSLGYSADQWQQWKNRGVRSEVRINAVHITAGNHATPGTTSYETRLTYDVTITRSVAGQEPESKQETVFVVMIAPCTAEYVVPSAFRDTLVALQMGDFGRIGDGY